jgi:hypothetical protein
MADTKAWAIPTAQVSMKQIPQSKRISPESVPRVKQNLCPNNLVGGKMSGDR